MTNVAVKKAHCPGCDTLLTLPVGSRVGKRVECPDCQEELEVISLNPPELDYAEWGDDWDDDDDDDY